MVHLMDQLVFNQLFLFYYFHLSRLFICLKKTNSISIANTGANNIVQWTIGQTSWKLIVVNANGTSGSSSSEVNLPSDVFLDRYGNVYVADTSNHRIQYFSSGETIGRTMFT